MALGIEVVLVSSRDRVLPGEDADAAEVLEDVLTRRGMEVLRSRGWSRSTRDGDQVTVTLTDGRTVTGLALPAGAGLDPQDRRTRARGGRGGGRRRGFITVDRVSRTTARGVYAAGDCTGVLMLASVAAMQGRIAMWHFLGDAVTPLDLRKVSSNVFTAPEIATVGWARRRSTRARSMPRRCASTWPATPRAKMQGVHDGFVKLFCRPGTGIIVGRSRGRAAGERADPPDLDRGRRVADRRPAGARVHGLSLDERLGRRGRPPAAPLADLSKAIKESHECNSRDRHFRGYSESGQIAYHRGILSEFRFFTPGHWGHRCHAPRRASPPPRRGRRGRLPARRGAGGRPRGTSRRATRSRPAGS